MLKAKYYCDICGREIVQKIDNSVPSIHIEGRHGCSDYDICDYCFADILEYLKNSKKKKESGEEE